jgi:hypothetical protein
VDDKDAREMRDGTRKVALEEKEELADEIVS